MDCRELSEEEIEEIDQAFHMFDKDNSGFIDATEIKTALHVLGNCPTDEELDQIMSSLDENGDGSVDKLEFRKLMAQYYKDPATEEDEIKEAFRVFDKDGNGTIDRHELEYVLTSLGDKMTEEELDDVFRKVDINNDGVICYDEFVKAMTEKAL